MISINVQMAIVHLFKSFLIEKELEPIVDEGLIKESLKYHILFEDKISKLVINNETLRQHIYNLFGKDSYKFNNTFYRTSVSEINKMSEFETFIDKISHYITTYGFESIGIYDDNTVYIPEGNLKLPEDKEENIVLIKGITKQELEDRVKSMIYSGLPLELSVINDLKIIINEIDLSISLDKIKNKEVKCIFSYKLGIIPDNGDEILRTLYYIAIKDTQIIKSKNMCREIREIVNFSDNRHTIYSDIKDELYEYFKKLKDKKEIIAESYLRNKHLWVSFKCSNPNNEKWKEINHFINQLRREAKRKHKPLKTSTSLNNLSELSVLFDYRNDPERLEKEELKNKIKAYNYLNNTISIINSEEKYCKSFKIRNNKVFVKEFEPLHVVIPKYNLLNEVRLLLYNNIQKEILNKIQDKKIYIPKDIKYVLPTSGKQFVNGVPEFSEIKFENSFMVGVHWENVLNDEKELRTDLDLKIIGVHDTIGWDYRSKKEDEIIFTGDLTTAPISKGGATEAFFIDKSYSDPFLVMLNNYTNSYDLYEGNIKGVKYKVIYENIEDSFLESKKEEFKDSVKDSYSMESLSRINANYLFDTNKCKTLNSFIGVNENSQKCLGLFNNHTYYFIGTFIGKGISAHRTEYLDNYLKTIMEYNKLTLNEIIKDNLVENKEDADIDLSLENISEDTFINLLFDNTENNEN